MVNQYEDLEPDDFKGYISDLLLEQLKEAGRNPAELELWNKIQAAATSTPAEIQEAQRLVSTYTMQFPKGPKISEAESLKLQLQQK